MDADFEPTCRKPFFAERSPPVHEDIPVSTLYELWSKVVSRFDGSYFHQQMAKKIFTLDLGSVFSYM